MQRIFSSPNLIEVTQLKDALERARIPCFIRNEISSGLTGEIPMTEGTPELWIQENNNMPEAMRIKCDWQSVEKIAGSDWICPECGETSPPQFDSCWKCRRSK
jgi:ribosomal protein L40E